MIIRVRKRLFIKPRFCSDCGRFCVFGESNLSTRCHECHKKHCRARKRDTRRKKRQTGQYLYTKRYASRKKKVIADHPYCALCGTTENLTCHHVGGGNNLTVLCDECHQAYEAWNNRKRNGIVRMIKEMI